MAMPREITSSSDPSIFVGSGEPAGLAHECSPTGLPTDQTLFLEAHQGLTDGDPADSVFLDELRFGGKALAGQIFVRLDLRAEHAAELIVERNFVADEAGNAARVTRRQFGHPRLQRARARLSLTLASWS